MQKLIHFILIVNLLFFRWYFFRKFDKIEKSTFWNRRVERKDFFYAELIQRDFWKNPLNFIQRYKDL